MWLRRPSCCPVSVAYIVFLPLQEGGELDKSSELLTFHEAISNLVESEEQLVEEHKAIIQVRYLEKGVL